MHFTRDIVAYEVDMINIENVSKFIIRDISLHIPKGEVTGLIGATGSGKTTLVRLASGLLLPDRGRVSVMGHEPVSFKGKFGSRLSVLISGVKSLSDEETAVSARAHYLEEIKKRRDEKWRSDMRNKLKGAKE